MKTYFFKLKKIWKNPIKIEGTPRKKERKKERKKTIIQPKNKERNSNAYLFRKMFDMSRKQSSLLPLRETLLNICVGFFF